MFCYACGSEIVSSALACPRCGSKGPAAAPPPLPPRSVTTSEFFFPKNGPALASYYLGIFSLIPGLGIVTGILAIIFGVKGVRLARAHPEARGVAHAWVGIVFGALFALGQAVLLAVLLLAKAKH
jgi:hypothetical protein